VPDPPALLHSAGLFNRSRSINSAEWSAPLAITLSQNDNDRFYVVACYLAFLRQD